MIKILGVMPIEEYEAKKRVNTKKGALDAVVQDLYYDIDNHNKQCTENDISDKSLPSRDEFLVSKTILSITEPSGREGVRNLVIPEDSVTDKNTLEELRRLDISKDIFPNFMQLGVNKQLKNIAEDLKENVRKVEEVHIPFTVREDNQYRYNEQPKQNKRCPRKEAEISTSEFFKIFEEILKGI